MVAGRDGMTTGEAADQALAGNLVKKDITRKTITK